MWEILIVLIVVGLFVMAMMLPRRARRRHMKSGEPRERFGDEPRERIGDGN